MGAPRSPVLRCTAVMLFSAASMFVQATTAPVIYPAKGQSPAQTDQDKVACFQWGKAQSGFDPMAPQAAPQAPPTQTAAAPQSGSSINGSMVKGAAGGAAVAELTKGDAGKGAAIGVISAGVRDRVKQQQAQQQKQAQQQQQQAQLQQQQQAARTQQKATFDRAFGACLEGRGYVVK